MNIFSLLLCLMIICYFYVEERLCSLINEGYQDDYNKDENHIGQSQNNKLNSKVTEVNDCDILKTKILICFLSFSIFGLVYISPMSRGK